MLIYKTKSKRKGFIKNMLNHLVVRRLSRLSKKHIASKKRQLVVFSFDHIAHRINVDGLFEKDELGAFFDWMSSVGVDFHRSNALDVGANIGNHSLYFSDYFDRVDSFEPNPIVYEVLRLNSRLATNVCCHNFGLSDDNIRSNIKIKPTNIGASSVTVNEGPDTNEIELKTIDSLDGIGNIKLIKIDVEGHELQVLSGATELIREQQPIILFEHHNSDFNDDEKSAVIDFLKENGYENFATIRKYPYAKKVFRKASGKNLMRSILPESVRIELSDYPERGTYVFIVAIPSWLEKSLPGKA